MPDLTPLASATAAVNLISLGSSPLGEDQSEGAFQNLLSRFIYKRTYSRWIPDLGRRETWDETVDRYITFLREERPNIPANVLEECRQGILSQQVMPSMRALWSAGEAARRDNTCMYNCSFVPVDSLRSFSEILYILMCGTGVGFSVERQFVSNLPAVQVQVKGSMLPYEVKDATEGWADALMFGMVAWFAGTDVDFDFSGLRDAGTPLKTKGGRASGPAPLRKMLAFAREKILAAAGRALSALECHDIVCQIAEVVMVGGFRRAALISVSDPDDLEMRHAKDWSRGAFPEVRYMSNNSSYWASQPTRAVFDQEWDALVQSKSGERGFSIDSWHKRADRPAGMIRTNPCVTGDTRVMTAEGLVQIEVLARMALRGVAEDQVAIDRRFNEGVRARAHSDTGNYAFKTGTKEVFTLKTQEGYQVRLTGDHRVMTSDGWKEAQALQPGDILHIANTEGGFGSRGNADAGMLGGWVTGDGCLLAEDNNSPRLYFYGADQHLVPQMLDATERLTGTRPSVSTYTPSERQHFECAGLREYLGQIIEDKFRVPEFVWQGTEDCQKSYLSALFSADGGVQGTRAKGVSVRLASSKLDLMRDVQSLLLNFGIASKVYEERRPAGYRDLPDGKGGYKSYLCNADHELVIAKDNLLRFNDRIGFIHQGKQDTLTDEIRSRMASVGVVGAGGRAGRGFYKETFTARFESLVSSGTEDVFDMTVPVTHSFVANGLVVHNCGEIGLRFSRSTNGISGEGGAGQFCNLTAAVMRPHDTLETMIEKVRLATWLGAIQTTFTYFPYLRDGWRKHCDEDRLLGVDITGQCDNPTLSGDPKVMTRLNQVALETAAEAAAFLDINMPVAVTCGKPSGNSSQLLDCASGFHTRHSPFYFRHVRIAGRDPLFKLIRDAGVPVFKENGQEKLDDEDVDVWVVRFPVKAPQKAMFRNDETALEQCGRYLHIMRTWCGERGHNQSATIYVRDHEWAEVGEWVFTNFDEITGLAFLPYDGGSYRLAPYEEITEGEYDAAMAVMPDVNFSNLTRYEIEDRGEGAVELACMGGACSIDYDQDSMEKARLD